VTIAGEQADGKNLMSSTWTKAAKVRRAFKAGRQRQKDLIYSMERAVIECRIVFLSIRKATVDAGIFGGEDVKVALACMTPEGSELNTVYLLPLARGIDGLAGTYAKAERLEKEENVVPLGVVLWQRDREANDAIDVWVQSWLVGPRATLASNVARGAFEKSPDQETRATF
jgi:hypothetical protein